MKVGDRVRVLKDESSTNEVNFSGREGKIIERPESMHPSFGFYVKFDFHGKMSFQESELEVIE